jgi:DNA-binding transcriptional regulator YiaG
MPNIGTVLREEITRLARKEARSQVDPTRQTSTRQRKEIAVLNRRVAQLERQIALLARKALGTPPAVKFESTDKRVRFTAKGLRAQRQRLGLSATDFGKLLGVSAQSIYNWEREAAHPRGAQVTRLAAMRGIGKREAAQRLQQLSAAGGRAARTT